jgi:lysophospholipid acyltransferase (LPLAT)-like uncharacterized protein
LRKIRDFLAAVLLTIFYRLYRRLWRVQRVRFPHEWGDSAVPRVYAHWHGDELLLVGAYIDSGMAVMTSRSEDGELMGRVLRWLGFRVVRGSSSRGGAGGLKGLVDAVRKEGRNASLAVDGPRGPIYEVKPGILKLAQQTGSILIPGAASANRRFVFKNAWNQCYLPLPFATCVIVYGEPISVPPDASGEELERLRLTLEHQLKVLKVEAEGRFHGAEDIHSVLGTKSIGA